jgi:hypothetical protein
MYEMWSENFSLSESYVVLKLNGSKNYSAHDIPNGTAWG